MPLLGDWWRTAPWFALSLGILTGCQGFPSPKPQPPFRAGESEPAEAAATAPSPPPSPPAVAPELAPAQDMVLPALPGTESPPLAATPLLDAAHQRLEEERQVMLGTTQPLIPQGPAEPTPEPAPEPGTAHHEPATPPVVSPPLDPTPEQANPEPESTSSEPSAPPPPDSESSHKRGGTLLDLARLLYTSALEQIRAEPSMGGATDPGAEDSEPQPLTIAELKLCRRVLGFGQFDAIDAGACKAGQPVILYCEVAGLSYEAIEDGRFRSRLAAEVEAVPEAGGPALWHQVLGTADDSCARPRHDYYVSYRVTLPASLPPGSYQLRLIEKDLATDTVASRALAIIVEP